MRRIFGDHKLPENLSAAEYDTFMHENFPQWIKEFEDSGFLEQTKLPAIQSEEELMEKLLEHKDDLLVLKFWKHACIPCLTFAEMYKAAADRCANEGRRVHWYSVDTKAISTKQLIEYQLIAGTPTVQTFTGCKQVGKEIRATNLEDLMQEITRREPKGIV